MKGLEDWWTRENQLRIRDRKLIAARTLWEPLARQVECVENCELAKKR